MKYDIVETDGTQMCQCTSKHVPSPTVLALITTERGTVTLCPTSMMNLTQLLWEYDLTDGDPLGSITKRYGTYVRDLADSIYEGSEAGVH
jgi:hypothetical protein